MTEKEIVEATHNMCIQSLSPDEFEKWESVKYWLEQVREKLK